MKNFNYNVSTRILFGRGKINEIGKEVKKYGDKVLIVYGKGSVKRNGLFDVIINNLREYGIYVYELDNIDPNPRIDSVYKGAEICRKEGVKLILAVGGGSVIDCSKAIAAQANYCGDIWQDLYVEQKLQDLKSVLPVASVLTLAATGSEMNGNSVISNMHTNQKLAIGHDLLRPVFSILDPEYTFTVNQYHTAAGIVDILSHLFEQYFTPDHDGYLQNRMMEAMMKTVIEYGPIAYQELNNYEARANLMWTSSLALNGMVTYGKVSTDWATHGMEHELSAFYDITHGVGLGILTPYWMKYVLSKDTVHRFVEYARNVWNLSGNDEIELANLAIEKTREFFTSIGIPSTLEEVGIDGSKLEEMAEQATMFGALGCMKKLYKEDVLAIYKMAL
ncbi:NADH-dependent butanol dehydrogenase A [Fusobacterium necrogenes]|uniref:NADH-dependent butanol dehydrogenase A n=1 Tax=Fusobacterium necrogenes TaxID=858 RepID=A0A377GWK4_9FUSO|nr:iron-containing alcohol dehydrogenase [Fusobacterium necrogenes]STO31380.1 NADH-dependent butanol dehydrogenase A [Fusobacterium necrogenes]